jgi:hypothetical protein
VSGIAFHTAFLAWTIPVTIALPMTEREGANERLHALRIQRATLSELGVLERLFLVPGTSAHRAKEG